jgi:hypothetical protein
VELVHKGTLVNLVLSYFPPATYLKGERYLGSGLLYYKCHDKAKLYRG